MVTAFDVKKRFGGGILANVGYTRDTAEGAIRSGAVDLVRLSPSPRRVYKEKGTGVQAHTAFPPRGLY